RPPSQPPKGLDGPEYLLVDGYNIIFAWDDLNALAQENLDAARGRLVDLLCNYRGFRQCEVIVVFDAYRVKGNPGEVERVHNISVVYTKEAETADMYIEKVTRELGKHNRVRVATSDALEQLIILGHGALRISADAFREEVAQVEQAIREYLESGGPAAR
ncbi:NYN domain-containing protein, partial [uncultured Anaerotruncus sp.]